MNADAWFDIVRKSRLVEDHMLSSLRIAFADCGDARTLAARMIGNGMLTDWQAQKLLTGKWKGFFVDHYCIQRKLGHDDENRTLILEAMDTRDQSIAVLSVVPPAQKRRDDGGLIYSIRQSE